jgi:hypothetical protein
MIRRSWTMLLHVTLGMTFAATALAQSDRGSITGTVTDATGGVVPGASVVAENPQTGTRYETVTTSAGSYTLPQVPVGTYNLTIELTGFGRFHQAGIRIYVAQSARVDAKLNVGGVAEEVNVVANASLLRTESAEQSSSITSENLNALPLNFGARGNFAAAAIRNPYTFVNLVPGGQISSYSSIKLNGAPLNTFQIRVEGMEANNQRLAIRTDQVQPSVESLEEMTVHTSNFAAEFGQVAGGIFNLTAKSGTNSLRGSAFQYFVNEAFGAGIPFTNDGKGGLVKPRNRRNNFGGSLGGPIMLPKLYDGHNKTFFFTAFEQFRQIETKAGLLGTMPTDAMRNGDFSQALTGRVLGTDPLGRPIMENAIYDPLTTRVVNGQVVRDPFPNNVIPQDRLDPVALRIQSFIPAATRPGLINNWDQSYPADTIKSIGTIKVDHSFGNVGKLSVYYSRYWGPHFNGTDGLPSPITKVRRIPTSTHTTRISYDWTLSSTTLLNTRVGYVRHTNPDFGLPEVANFDPVSGLGLTGAIDGRGFPVLRNLYSSTGGGICTTGGTCAGDGLSTDGSFPSTRKPQFLTSLTHARSSHTIKTGFEWRNDEFRLQSIANAYGTYNFDPSQSGLPSTQGQNLAGGNVGLPYASFLLGLANTAAVSNSPAPDWQKPTVSLYVQDTWRMRTNLTVDYGLRWDYQGFPYEKHDRRSMFAPDVANPSAGGLLGATAYEGDGEGACNCRFVETYKYAFAPRFGASYQIDERTVLRGGWGLSYAQTGEGQSDGGGTLGAGGWNTINFQSAAFGSPGATLRNGLIYNRDDLFRIANDPGIRPTPGQLNLPSAWVHPDAGHPPRLSQWSASLQRELGRDLMVEVAYVGNRGTGFTWNQLTNLNAISLDRLGSFGLDINSTADQALLRSRLDSPLAQQRGFRAPYEGYSLANTVAQSLRPFPQFGNLTTVGAPGGKTWYDSLQIKATKRYSQGLNVTGTFAWQREHTNMVPISDVFADPDSHRTVSSLSEPMVAVLAFNYEIPAIERNRVLRAIVSGWTIGGIVRYASGLPIPVPLATTNLDTLLFQTTRMNRVEGEPLFLHDLNGNDFDPNQDFVLNPKAWVNPAQGQFGTSLAYYDDFRYQRRPDEQFSLGRMFSLSDRVKLHVRGEFFNVFNRIALNNPNATNPLQTQQVNAAGVPISGFGRIDTGSVFGPPRSGQIVSRVTW